MSKRITNYARFAVALLVLTCCSNEIKTEYFAKESHLENIIFVGQENQNNQFMFNGDELIITKDEFEVKPDVTPSDAKGKKNRRMSITILKSKQRVINTSSPDQIIFH